MYAADDSDDDAGHPGCVDELDPPEPHATARGPPSARAEDVGCRPSSATRARAPRADTPPTPSVRPENRWGADPRLLQYRAAPPPRDDPTAIRGTLPAFGTARRLGTAETFRRENRNALVSGDAEKTQIPVSQGTDGKTSEESANGPAMHPMFPMLPTHSTQHNAHVLGDPVRSINNLPEHTKRLLFAQAMLNKQRLMNDECERLIIKRRVHLLRRRDAARREALEARAREEDLARRGEEVDKTLGNAELAMNAKRGFRNVARHLSSMRNLSLAKETKLDEKKKPAHSFARARREAQANALESATKDANGYVDLRPEPPLPPVPALLSLAKNPVVPDEKHVYAVTKRKPKKTSRVREAALAAAAVAGDDAVAAWRSARTARDDIEAFARAYDDDEFPDEEVPGDEEDEVENENAQKKNAHPETYVRYHHRSRHNRWDGVCDDSSDDEDDPRDVRKRERDRLEAAAETHAARLEKDAKAASSVGKFTKAEHHLRQLVALRVAGGGGSRVVLRDKNVSNGEDEDVFVSAARNAADPQEGSEMRVSVDPVDAARALVLLARAVTAQRNPRRLEEVEALFHRAAAALAAENGDDDAGVAADSDAEASTRLAALDGLSAACAAFNSARRDDDALRYARRALAYAEKRFGPWDLRVARSARTAAARWLRVGGGGGGGVPSDGTRSRSEPILRESAGVATATAIDLLRDALEVTEKALGKNHALAIETLCELAAAHKRARDFPRAQRIDEERRARRRHQGNARGTDTPHT